MLIEALMCLTSMSSVAAACHEAVPQPDPVELHYALIHHHTEEVEATTASYEPRDVWWELAVCESGMNGVPRWDYDGGSGYDGALQFHPNTWSSYRPSDYPAYAYQATPEQQIAVGRMVAADQGSGAWPSCTSKLGISTEDLLQ